MFYVCHAVVWIRHAAVCGRYFTPFKREAQEAVVRGRRHEVLYHTVVVRCRFPRPSSGEIRHSCFKLIQRVTVRCDWCVAIQVARFAQP